MQQRGRWPPRQTAGSFSATSACGCRRAVAAPRADRDDRAGKAGRCKGRSGGGRCREERRSWDVLQQAAHVAVACLEQPVHVSIHEQLLNQSAAVGLVADEVGVQRAARIWSHDVLMAQTLHWAAQHLIAEGSAGVHFRYAYPPLARDAIQHPVQEIELAGDSDLQLSWVDLADRADRFWEDQREVGTVQAEVEYLVGAAAADQNCLFHHCGHHAISCSTAAPWFLNWAMYRAQWSGSSALSKLRRPARRKPCSTDSRWNSSRSSLARSSPRLASRLTPPSAIIIPSAIQA